jgi:DNA polymerase-3 subunit gamma/tau
MDAASNTGVDDVREIIEAVRYAAVSARYKVYIVDEVHMLSKNAFNALLKTLEEPPAHVKFLFATTEVNKVPVTVLSRCQRFDLRRISAEQLAEHFAKVCEAEQVVVEPEALVLIARAAEGSARDGLSILDQAIAHGAEGVTAAQVREMLGLSDRGAIRDLLGTLLAGDAQAALAAVRGQHDLGVEPAALFRGLLEAVHGITRAKVGGPQDPAQSVEEREAYAGWAGKLSHALIHRLWQLLLKGLGEVNSAPLALEAAEMALLRVIHASELPDPGALIDRCRAASRSPRGATSPQPPRPKASQRQPRYRRASLPWWLSFPITESRTSRSRCTISSASSAMPRPTSSSAVQAAARFRARARRCAEGHHRRDLAGFHVGRPGGTDPPRTGKARSRAPAPVGAGRADRRGRV